MNPKTARKLIDSAIQFHIHELALAIAQAPDADINANMPEIVELRELIASDPAISEMAKREANQ